MIPKREGPAIVIRGGLAPANATPIMHFHTPLLARIAGLLKGCAAAAARAESSATTAATRDRNAAASTAPVAQSVVPVGNIALSLVLTSRVSA